MERRLAWLLDVTKSDCTLMVIMPSWHHAIMASCHYATVLACYHAIMSSCHYVIRVSARLDGAHTLQPGHVHVICPSEVQPLYNPPDDHQGQQCHEAPHHDESSRHSACVCTAGHAGTSAVHSATSSTLGLKEGPVHGPVVPHSTTQTQ